jgi:twitching motility protein PilT
MMVGEVRDEETARIATQAALTGHLVFSTLHTNDAKQTLDRIVDTFPAEAHGQVRAQLALTLQAVISQRLVNRADGTGRVAAMEILINSPNVRDLIAEGKTSQIEKAMQASGDYYRMQTFNMALAQLVRDKAVTEEDALATSTNPGDLRLMLKGVQKSGVTSVRPAEESPGPKIVRFGKSF